MATEVRTITDVWCDIHLLRDGERIEGGWSGTIGVNGLIKHLDLCDACREEVIGQLSETLEAYGTKPNPKDRVGRFASGPEVGDEQYICPACRNAFASRGSLTSHCRSTHGKPLAILEIEAGLEPSRKPPEQLTCPTCGKVVLGKQGMGSHTAAMHPGGANQPKLVKVG